MNWRDIPIISTIIVLAAVATMVALGFWQLGRLDEKEALIASYSRAETLSTEVPWPGPADYESSLFRRSSVNCREVEGIDSVAGRSARGASGWAFVARCTYDGQGIADVAIGWSRNPQPPEWSGGKVTGVIAPYKDVVRLVAAQPPLPELEALAKPDPADLPNNHLAYAGQWFFFALTALVIFVLAVRRRKADMPD